jgi:hypothetical protein
VIWCRQSLRSYATPIPGSELVSHSLSRFGPRTVIFIVFGRETRRNFFYCSNCQISTSSGNAVLHFAHSQALSSLRPGQHQRRYSSRIHHISGMNSRLFVKYVNVALSQMVRFLVTRLTKGRCALAKFWRTVAVYSMIRSLRRLAPTFCPE